MISKRLLVILTVGAFSVAVASILQPVNSTIMRVALLGALAGSWIGTLLLVWTNRPARYVVSFAPIVVAIPFLLPGRAIESDSLHDAYVKHLMDLDGVPYYWGGENIRGIDCSGLPRRALRDALVEIGHSSGNGRAFHLWLEHWWFDATAKSIAQGYRDYALPLPAKGILREMSYEGLEPGDLAVTKGGVHMLAYAGEGKWIQADPGVGRVLLLDGRTGENTWFSYPVETFRWAEFCDP